MDRPVQKLHLDVTGVQHTSPNLIEKASGKLIPARMELVRLAIPRRVYTQSHIDYVIESLDEIYRNREQMRGYRIVEEPPVLRHFTAKFEPITR